MEYRLGKGKRIFEQGQTTALECPNCKNKVQFSVFTNLDTKLIPQLPVVKFENVYFLVCPKCSAVFGVDNQNGKLFRKGEKLAIGDFDLKDLKDSSSYYNKLF